MNEGYKKYFGNIDPMIITPWLRVGENKNVEIFLSFGATEAKPPEDVDAIFDIIETGTTLTQNNLKIIDTVMESTAVLVAKLHIFVNVEEKNLDSLLKNMPALKKPTISSLSEKGWYGVNTIIDKNEFIKIVPIMRKLAQGLVVMETRQILPLDEINLDEHIDKDASYY
jgi:ATP phosphoribosyltransferase